VADLIAEMERAIAEADAFIAESAPQRGGPMQNRSRGISRMRGCVDLVRAPRRKCIRNSPRAIWSPSTVRFEIA